MSELARAVAAHGLPSSRQLPDTPLDAGTFTELLEECERHRVLGFLGGAVRTGRFPVDDEQRAQLEASLLSWLSHSLRVERLLLRAVDALDRAGVPSRVLKGAALAHTVYADPSLRVFGDVDLLVPGSELDRAVILLCAALGARRAQPELRPGFDARFGKEVLLRVPGDPELELDLHRMFVEGALGLTIALDDLFMPAYRFPLAGRELQALPMPARLLHACYAAAVGDWPPRLSSQRDVAQLVLHERPHVADVLLTARRWRCEVIVASALDTAWRDLALTERPPIVEWAARYQPTRMDRVLIGAHQGPARVHQACRCGARASRDGCAHRLPARHCVAPTNLPPRPPDVALLARVARMEADCSVNG